MKRFIDGRIDGQTDRQTIRGWTKSDESSLELSAQVG